MRDFRVSESTLIAIQVQIGSFRAERGGILGQDSDGVIRHFVPDCNAICGAAEYSPDIDYLNQIIPIWKELGITFCGFVHSHPRGFRRPSHADEAYATSVFLHFERLDMLWLPIVQTRPESGAFEILPFAASRPRRLGSPCKIRRSEMSILESVPRSGARRNANGNSNEFQEPTGDVDHTSIYASLLQERGALTPHVADARSPGSVLTENSGKCIDVEEIPSTNYDGGLWCGVHDDLPSPRLARIAKAFDLGRHRRALMVVVGTGGSASFILNSARMGIGRFVLIDPDTISESNVATQSADPASIGEFKVHALARQIKNINPGASVQAIAKRIEDIDDSEFAALLEFQGGHEANIVHESVRTTAILMLLTDNFWAQARGHRLALQFGLPAICAQEYQEGLGAEVTFTMPGVTPACHRCLTSSRYRAYLESKFSNNTTSEGAPVFAAEFINAILGHILLAVLYHGTPHPRFGGLVNDLRERNLIRVRMNTLFDDFFGDAFSRRIAGAREAACFRMLDCIFLFQAPDVGQSTSRPRCPDCLGTGNLADAKGTFMDTRDFRPFALLSGIPEV
jgi:hypothetical protein